jgi:hypothetical protein
MQNQCTIPVYVRLHCGWCVCSFQTQDSREMHVWHQRLLHGFGGNYLWSWSTIGSSGWNWIQFFSPSGPSTRSRHWVEPQFNDAKFASCKDGTHHALLKRNPYGHVKMHDEWNAAAGCAKWPPLSCNCNRTTSDPSNAIAIRSHAPRYLFDLS